jgi:hypothetical protein
LTQGVIRGVARGATITLTQGVVKGVARGATMLM